ncbi:MAG: thiol peroxidase, partial [Candidatus Omnitrophica bacterium]|nr:thiol peroxidase [Candidatus Omnitrophota bacterium]
MAVATARGSATERTGVVTFKGSPLTLIGPEILVGAQAPEFEVLGQDLSVVKSSDAKGKV